MHPPSIGSPMPPLTPPLLDNKQGLEDRRVPRPIGGERAQRKLPLSSASSGFGGVGEFGNKLWCFSSDTEWMSSTSPQMSAAPLPSSVMTSSVVTGGNMAYNLNSFQREGHGSGVALDSVGTFPDSLGPADRSLDPTMQSQQMMLPMFVNGLQGPFPIQHQPIFTSRGGGGGGGGDHGGSLPTMWSQGIKTGPSEAGDGEPWRNWSRTDM
ncbi:uncharacterized protein LOC112558663 [Pomacea canaliculata]|uniref:uncharacterized protein LOC112558663 n=1 Tax=Pomacea canaliculata TaxID=400727 RepID=UPI000D7371C7|nr:uncharacterized protein LOC112558663 [Pomacea canaliculata]